MLRSLLLVGATLPAFFSLTVADSVSLSDFQRLPGGLLVPLSCTLAYRKTIPNCDASDFQDGAACSSDCIQGLEQISLSVNTNCPGVIADSNSLLGQIFQGQLVSLLCPNSRTTTTSATPEKTTAVETTPAATPPATSTPAKATTTPPPPASIVIPPQSTSLSFSTKSVKSSAAGGLGDETPTSSTTVATSTSLDGIGTPPYSTTSALQRQTAAPKSGGGQSAQSQQAAALANTGGGSLFDVSEAGTSSGTARVPPSIASLLCASLCVLYGALWLGR